MTDIVQDDAGSTGLDVAAQFLTFLIADVRGYTRYTMEHGDRGAAALAMKFAALARDTVSGHGGEVIELRGDEALAVFSSSGDAVRAASELQAHCAEATRAAPEMPVKVGIGVDTGEAVPVEGGYRGLALNTAARLCALAGPGEVYGTTEVVQSAQKLDGLAYVERGRVRLKGFDDLVRVIQILPEDDLPAGFPPLVSLVAAPSNLPVQSTPFIGREREVTEVSAILRRDEVRLLSLTGAGGAGKTRLALHVGAALLDDFERGVFFVQLATLAAPGSVISALASTLKIKEVAGQPLRESVYEYLADREILLVLDNFEHLLEDAPAVSDLLATCPHVRALVTSRAVLHLSVEHVYTIPPLSVPDLSHLPDVEAMSRYDAVELFVRRARAAKADFVLTRENVRDVAEICVRLDGLPLALELAAARVRAFPPHALARKLSSRLKLLTGGGRDLPARQQTLRSALDWSYGLLVESEQVLFARLSVFAGGCTVETAEEVCDPEGELDLDVLDGITSLVDKSLLRVEGDEEPHFSMLQTIREYALERLNAGGQAETLRRRHGERYLAMAEESEHAFHASDQETWLQRLDAEHDNLRAALQWALDADEDEIALRLSSAVQWFWQVHESPTEGRAWLERSLARSGDAATPARIKALHGAGWLALLQCDLPGAKALFEECLELATVLDDESTIAESLRALGSVANLKGNYQEAGGLIEESLDRNRRLKDTWATVAAINELGQVAASLAEFERAEALFEEGLVLVRRLGQRRGVAILLYNLAFVARSRRGHERAKDLYEQSLAIFRDIGEKVNIAKCLQELSVVAQVLGHDEEAGDRLLESLSLYRELDDKRGLAEWIEHDARVAALQGRAGEAARLLGAAQAARDMLGARLSPGEESVLERDLRPARDELGDGWETARRQGTGLTLEDAIEYALRAATA
ncbi:MAG: ATP-binding protein [Chloroflexota bacterium]